MSLLGRRGWSAAGLCLVLFASAHAQGGDAGFHTSPACWDKPRIYHAGDPPQEIADQVHLVEAPPGADGPGEATVSPNGAYRFWLRQPITTRPGPWGAGIIVDTEHQRHRVLLLENVIQPINPRWLTEKLIYLRVIWGRVVFSDIIYDVEANAVIYHEIARDGQIAFQQFQQAECPTAELPADHMGQQADAPAVGTQPPVAPVVAEAPLPPDDELPEQPDVMPASKPGTGVMIGLVTLPTIFGPPETGGIVPAENPVPVPVYAAPEAGAAKVAEPDHPDDFQYQEYTYEGAAAVVYQQVPGWYQIALSDGQKVWLSAKSAGEYLPIGELLTQRPAYLNEHWDRKLWESPYIYKGWNSRLPHVEGDRVEHAVRIKAYQQTPNGLWLQIETLSTNGCGGGVPRVVDQGWIPAYATTGQLVAGYHSRGC